MKTAAVLLSLILSSSQAFAGVLVYSCQLDGSNNPSDSAALVYFEKGMRVTWMPDETSKALKTTKANATGVTVNDEIMFTLFAFQDQADQLMVPSQITHAPKTIKVYTYRDDDDVEKDRQEFTCTQ